jgi:NADH-quinone oxidoreductase subunit C
METGMAGQEAIEKLRTKLGPGFLGAEDLNGEACAVVESAVIADAAAALKDDPLLKFDFLMDLAGADYQGYPDAKPGRFCVAYRFFSSSSLARVCVKAYLPAKNPNLPSLCGLWAGANWLEREVFDMFGVRFTGHPDLRRILMYDEFVGHPLRKDYPLNQQQPRVPMRKAVDFEQVRHDRRSSAQD